MIVAKHATALSVFGDMTCTEVKALLDVSNFPIVVIDSDMKLNGILDEKSFWKHAALYGFETKIIHAINTNFKIVMNESELVNRIDPNIEYWLVSDENGEYKVYDAVQVMDIQLRHQHEAVKQMNRLLEEELDVLREQRQQLKQILDSSYDEIFVTDAEGNVLYVSESSKKFMGLPPDVFIGKNMRDLVEKGIIHNSVTLEVLKTKSIVSHQQLYVTGITVLATGKPVFNEEGELSLVIINSRDITELVDLRNQIAQANSVIDHQNRFLLERKSNPILIRMNTRSEKMVPLIDLVEKVAPTDSSVLIEGESGVGKSILARIIHDASKRKEKNFIQINCGAIPPSLMESELFGYEGGSFTGANKNGKIGLVEQAEGGTLFLDEIGELPLDLQVKLLQLVQEKTFIPVGGTKMKKVDIRIISATNKNLKQKIKEKLFREDLYYRLHVVPIVIPPLRERPEDIPLLIHYFLNRFNKKYEQCISLADSVMQLLLGYEWPGNIRELENLMEQLVVTSKGPVIYPEGLPRHLSKSSGTKLPGVAVSGILQLNKAVEETERQILKLAITKYKTSRKIAKALGVNQTTIIRKIHKYDLHFHEEDETRFQAIEEAAN
ncbi:UNVERIFIED_CONTAM: PAS domain S-box-containing protein/TyrR family helix-turn-helix protein [Brevibacillus sp. OAP136]